MLTLTRVSTLVVTILAITGTDRHPLSPAEQLHILRDKLRQSRIEGDWRLNLANAKAQKALLNETPASLLDVARAEVHLNHLDAAFGEISQFVRMAQFSDLLESLPDFDPLRKHASFAEISAAMKANRRTISLGTPAFRLSDLDLLAEDVDYDPDGKRFFITSVREKKLISADSSGATIDFAKAPDGWPMLAIKVDAARAVLWTTEVALQGFTIVPQSEWGRSAVLCYDLKTGKLLRRIEGPRGSAFGDMALLPNGDVIVSDGEGGAIYRIPANGAVLERIDGGDFISPQTSALHPDGRHLFVPDYLRGIGVLDLASKQVNWISMGKRFALNGIDGLYFDRGLLIAVQNGTSPERVVAFRLDPGFTKVESETILEQSTSTLGDPTHGVVVGRDFYYIANSGWDIVDNHGNVKPNTKPSAPIIMRMPPRAFHDLRSGVDSFEHRVQVNGIGDDDLERREASGASSTGEATVPLIPR